MSLSDSDFENIELTCVMCDEKHHKNEDQEYGRCGCCCDGEGEVMCVIHLEKCEECDFVGCNGCGTVNLCSGCKSHKCRDCMSTQENGPGCQECNNTDWCDDCLTEGVCGQCLAFFRKEKKSPAKEIAIRMENELTHHNRITKERKESIEKILKKWKSSSMASLIKKGKSGKIETFFFVKNWDTLAWSPEDLNSRLAIPLGIQNISGTTTQVLTWVVPPSKKDPNLYSLQHHFVTNTVHLLGVTEVRRLVDLWLITGMSNGVVGFSLSEADKYQGIHMQAWNECILIKDLFNDSAWYSEKKKK